jgi:hypothetical protein
VAPASAQPIMQNRAASQTQKAVYVLVTKEVSPMLLAVTPTISGVLLILPVHTQEAAVLLKELSDAVDLAQSFVVVKLPKNKYTAKDHYQQLPLSVR